MTVCRKRAGDRFLGLGSSPAFSSAPERSEKVVKQDPFLFRRAEDRSEREPETVEIGIPHGSNSLQAINRFLCSRAETICSDEAAELDNSSY